MNEAFRLELAILKVVPGLDEVEATLVEQHMQRKLKAVKEVDVLRQISEEGWRIQAIERATRIGSPSIFYLQREARESYA